MTLDLATIVRQTHPTVLEVGPGQRRKTNHLLPPALGLPVRALRTDSRLTEIGDVFLALPGERTDGHQHVRSALAAGALGAIVAHVPDDISSLAPETTHYLFVVDDPLVALHQLARAARRRWNPIVIGVTGSVGKTTTKEIIAALLAPALGVLRNEANLNTEIGLPLTLLRLGPEHQVAVLEMGMYGPGDIAILASIAEPTMGVVTNVGPIHLERVGSIERIARTKAELIMALPKDGLALLNGDDPWVRAMALTSGIATPLTFGFGADCDFRATDIEHRGLEGMSFTVRAEGRAVRFQTGVAGRHTIPAFLAGAAIGRRLGMAWDDIVSAAGMVALRDRQRLVALDDEVLLIDDSYNASPPSMKAALDLLAAAPGAKVAVLGDMLELGPGEEPAHRDVGMLAADVADWLIVRGPRAVWIAEEAVRRGMAPERVIRAQTNGDAALAITALVEENRRMQRPGTGHAWVILVKGSRGMRMEEIVNSLTGGA